MPRPKTDRPQGRPLLDHRMFYSDEHERVLRHCAMRAKQILWANNSVYVDLYELMAEGWWYCMRRCPEGNLRPAITNTIKTMVRYAFAFYVERRGFSRARACLSPEGEDLMETVPDDRPTPEEWCIISEN